MKLANILIVAAIILLTIAIPQALCESPGKHFYDSSSATQTDPIEVPAAKNSHIKTDGMFQPGEWDDALIIPIADKYSIYFKADSETLFVGLKSIRPLGELVSEIRFTSDEKEVFLLHVSGALGEGVSGFPATTKFEVNTHTLWDANFLMADPAKKEAWEAAGSPMDNYDDIYNKRDGIEYKIDRKKIKRNSLKLTIGWIRVEVEGGKINKNVYNYPESAGFKNADNWAKLILPD